MAHYLEATKPDNDARKDLFEGMLTAVEHVGRLYSAAFNKRKAILDPIAHATRFQTRSVMVIGLGASNVLETGLTLNPLYGTPMIPGTSIKGIVAHYCSTVLGAADSRYKGPNIGTDNESRQKAGEIYEALFGKLEQSMDEAGGVNKIDAESGFLRFYDAWMVPEDVAKSLVPDVMTPHHGDYYMGSAEVPTDFDDPNPVTFMTVKGTFEVHIGCEEPDEEKRKAWLKFANDIAKSALTAFGVGGKTRAGYGRMKPVKQVKPPKPPKEQKIVIADFVGVTGGKARFKVEGKTATFNPPVIPQRGQKQFKAIVVREDANSYVLKLAEVK